MHLNETNKLSEQKLDTLISLSTLILENQNVLFKALSKLIHMEKQTMLDLANLQAALAADTDAVNAAVTLITTMADEIKAANAAGNQAAVNAVADQFMAQAKALADAVAANTPAAPVVADTPAVQ